MSSMQRTVTIIPANPMLQQTAVKRQLNVAAYCRVSTEEEEQQSSYEAQCSYYTDKIMGNPEWNMAGIYADEGISGTSTKKRESFNRMIRKCRQKKIDLILTKSISRFARNTLDCLRYVRALKEMGIGVWFEKENINTLDMDTELILTFMGAFAQSESESISANVKWGIRHAMKEGKVSINFEKLYGYRLDADGNPELDPDQSAVVIEIFNQFLRGASLRMIKEYLEEKGVLNPSGDHRWNIAQIGKILANEKYCGDVLMQKTFVQDCISKKVVKNTGQLPMYLIQNNHPAIVSREMFQAAQAERTRRSARESSSKKTSSTGRSCYASKYALSERLVCGECGTMYRRCTWKRNGKVKIVWRCISRLDYGTTYCHDSPTMEEGILQQAIMDAINSLMSSRKVLSDQLSEAMQQELVAMPGSALTLGEVKRRLEERDVEFQQLLSLAANDGTEAHLSRFSTLSAEITELKRQQEELASLLRTNSRANLRLHKAMSAMDQMDYHMTEWDEQTIRQIVHTVKVISAERIKVILTDGTEIDQEVRKQ